MDINSKDQERVGIIDNAERKVTYGGMAGFVKDFFSFTGINGRTLVFLLMRNDAYSALNYLGCLGNRIVPILVSEKTDFESLKFLIGQYHPSAIIGRWHVIRSFGYSGYRKLDYQGYVSTNDGEIEDGYILAGTGLAPFEMHEDLSLLLTTSGSTGSPKFVRHTYRNIEYQAEKISGFFEMDGTERPLVDLPIMYTYGLSILNSYLYAGATVLLSDESFTKKHFWDFFKQQEATSITGVPYTFEMLKRLRFFRMDLPSLRMLSQGGGKLASETQMEFVRYIESKGGRYYATYGASEGSARMAFLPYHLASAKCGSIGKTAGNDRMYLKDEEGNVIAGPHEVGELYFEGENVTMGYAESGIDLIKGDERNGVLATGDMAYFDEDGYFYIVGRKKRFLKLFGHRVSLDECEAMIRNKFCIDCACTGDDEKLYICLEDGSLQDGVKKYLLDRTNLYASSVETKVVKSIPKNEAGKTLYAKLKEML